MLALFVLLCGCSRSALGADPLGGVADPPPPHGSSAQPGSGGNDGSGGHDGSGGTRPPVFEGPPVDAVGGDGDGAVVIPNGPQGGIRNGNFCVGFGISVPVIDQPAPAGPFVCGQDCAYGMDCPDGYQCWGVFEPGVLLQLPSGDYRSPTDIVAYQCFPPWGRCPADAAPGTLCGSCRTDADCR